MVSDRTGRWAGLAGRVTGSLCIWLGLMTVLAWLVLGVGFPLLLLLILASTPSSEVSPDYEGTFGMGAFLTAFTVTGTTVPLAFLLFALGGLMAYLTEEPLFLGPLRRPWRWFRSLSRER